MELACDIVRKRSVAHNVTDVLDRIKRINLRDPIVSHNKNVVRAINEILGSIVECNDDIVDSLLMAYFISTHTVNDLKGTINDPKLINAANALVSCIENSDKKYVENTFFECIDHYYSLYKMSKSSNEISKIEQMFNKLEEKIKAHILASRKGHKLKVSRFKLINKMFNVSPMIATKKLLSSYKLISAIPDVSNVVWNAILNSMNDNVHNREHLFLIMVAELRIMMVPKLNSSTDRRNIYYNIDIEEIIHSIRDRSLSTIDVTNILHIFADKTIDITIQQYDQWNNEFNEFIIDFFHKMFDQMRK